jgi:hypothetical protein
MENLNRRVHLEDQGIGERILLKWVLIKQGFAN